jgi:hypothetical protein
MKNNFIKTSILLLSLTFFTNSSFAQNDCLKIGDEYQGGIIFYIDQTGEHGLIAAPSDEPGFAIYGCLGNTSPIADNSEIGSGDSNTQGIVNYCEEEGIAARLCSDLSLNGYSDWFLPSINELEMLYLNRNAVGGFDNTETSAYISSTEARPAPAYYRSWAYDFGSPQLIPYTRKVVSQKDNTFKVRAIRKF